MLLFLLFAHYVFWFIRSVHVVFGQVVSGKEVVSQIEMLPVDRNSRPLQDARVSKCGELVLLTKSKGYFFHFIFKISLHLICCIFYLLYLTPVFISQTRRKRLKRRNQPVAPVPVLNLQSIQRRVDLRRKLKRRKKEERPKS